MKKILLMMMAAIVSAMTLQAQEEEEWEASFSPVASADDLGGLHVAVVADGSAYVSTTYSQGFTFGSTTVADPEGLVSAAVVKYDGKGNEQWAVALEGAAVVRSLVAAADGTLYASGTVKEDVAYTSADGSTGTLSGTSDGLSAFVLKVSASGRVEQSQVFRPEAPTACDEYWGDLSVVPMDLSLDGDRLYVSASFSGDVPSLGWTGSYVDYYWGMAYLDNRSVGVFSLGAADLGGARGEATVQPTVPLIDGEEGLQCYAEAFTFAAQGGQLRVGFVGFGNLTLSTPSASKGFSFAMEGEGMNEHGLVLASVDGSSVDASVFHAAAYDSFRAAPSLTRATFAGGKAYVGGTFYGNFWFDEAVTKEANTAFAAAIDLATGDVDWAVADASGESSYGIALAAGKDGLLSFSTAGVTVIDPADGSVGAPVSTLQVSDFAHFLTASAAYVYGDGARVCVGGFFDEDEAQDIADGIAAPGQTAGAAAASSAVRHNLAGQRVGAGYKGIVVVGGRKVLQR